VTDGLIRITTALAVGAVAIACELNIDRRKVKRVLDQVAQRS
jgi:hypothetical protein